MFRPTDALRAQTEARAARIRELLTNDKAQSLPNEAPPRIRAGRRHWT
jgi:hypothetical protein